MKKIINRTIFFLTAAVALIVVGTFFSSDKTEMSSFLSPETTVSASINQSNYPNVEYDTDRPGADYNNFDLPRADFELCRKACADDANCMAYTYVKPGVQGTNARCWLKSSIPNGGPSSCCISGTKTYKGRKGGAAEIDLSGTWDAVVNSSEGRWDYTMVLNRQSSGKWTGTLYITLDGKSPTTTEAAVESLGGGKINLIWRPGKPNAQSFEGTATKERINVSGYGGQLSFTRR